MLIYVEIVALDVSDAKSMFFLMILLSTLYLPNFLQFNDHILYKEGTADVIVGKITVG